MGVFDELHGCITTLDVFTRLRYLPAREISLDDLDEALARLVDPASTTGVRIMAEGVARFEIQRLRDHLSDRFVVDFEPGLHGPFSTREAAQDWASAHASAAPPGSVVSWCVRPLQHAPT